MLDRLYSTIVYELPVAHLLILLFCFLFSQSERCRDSESRAMLEYNVGVFSEVYNVYSVYTALRLS